MIVSRFVHVVTSFIVVIVLILGQEKSAIAQNSEQNDPPQPVSIDSVRTKTFSLTFSSTMERCMVEVSFPQIVDSEDEPIDDTIDHPGETAVNLMIVKAVEAEATQILDLCDYNTNHTKKYTIHFNRNGLLSITVHSEMDETSDPYKMTIVEGLLFDYHKGKRIRLSNFLKGEYQEVVNKRAQKILQSMGFEDATPFIEDDTPFCITASHVIFFIDIENPPVAVPISHTFLDDYLSRDVNKPVAKKQ